MHYQKKSLKSCDIQHMNETNMLNYNAALKSFGISDIIIYKLFTI